MKIKTISRDNISFSAYVILMLLDVVIARHEAIVECGAIAFRGSEPLFCRPGKKRGRERKRRDEPHEGGPFTAELLIIDASAFARFCSHLSCRKGRSSSWRAPESALKSSRFNGWWKYLRETAGTRRGARREEIEHSDTVFPNVAFPLSVLPYAPHLYHTWDGFPTRHVRVILNATRESIFFLWRSYGVESSAMNIFPRTSNRSQLYSFTEKSSVRELLSISTADRCGNNQREFPPHACFFERIAIPRSAVIHSDYFSRKEQKSEPPAPLPLLPDPLNRRDSVTRTRKSNAVLRRSATRISIPSADLSKQT